MITENQYRLLKEIQKGRDPELSTEQDIDDMIWLLEAKLIEAESYLAVQQLYKAAEMAEEKRKERSRQSPDDRSYDLHPAALYAIGFLIFSLLCFIFKFF